MEKHLPLQLQDISLEAAIFVATKQEKNKYGSYSNSCNYFLHFNFFARNVKNQIETMI